VRGAPIPDLPGITPEQGGSTQSRRSRGRDIDRLDPIYVGVADGPF
jgi:hypothetical protein